MSASPNRRGPDEERLNLPKDEFVELYRRFKELVEMAYGPRERLRLRHPATHARMLREERERRRREEGR